jgi:hypothetical protein
MNSVKSVIVFNPKKISISIMIMIMVIVHNSHVTIVNIIVISVERVC